MKKIIKLCFFSMVLALFSCGDGYFDEMRDIYEDAGEYIYIQIPYLDETSFTFGDADVSDWDQIPRSSYLYDDGNEIHGYAGTGYDLLLIKIAQTGSHLYCLVKLNANAVSYCIVVYAEIS